MAPSANPATPPSATSQPLSPLAAMTPYRNSTTSLPSRSTATPTTTASASNDFEPSTTARPAARNSPASSRPCRAIQTLCQVSVTTATQRITALNSPCPIPANKFDNALANIATPHAANTPASTPPPIHRLRCATERVTASTMPMIRPASKTSRKTMISAASTTRPYFTTSAPRAVFSLYSSKNSYRPAFCARTLMTASLLPATTFSTFHAFLSNSIPLASRFLSLITIGVLTGALISAGSNFLSL